MLCREVVGDGSCRPRYPLAQTALTRGIGLAQLHEWHCAMPRKERFRNVGAGKGVKAALDPATLRRLYVDEGLTQARIAADYGCTAQFVSLLLAEYGISSRKPRTR